MPGESLYLYNHLKDLGYDKIINESGLVNFNDMGRQIFYMSKNSIPNY